MINWLQKHSKLQRLKKVAFFFFFSFFWKTFWDGKLEQILNCVKNISLSINTKFMIAQRIISFKWGKCHISKLLQVSKWNIFPNCFLKKILCWLILSLWIHTGQFLSIWEKKILDFVNLCNRQTGLFSVFFFFPQVEGLDVRSSLFPLFCNIYMHYSEEKLFSVYKFPHWFR